MSTRQLRGELRPNAKRKRDLYVASTTPDGSESMTQLRERQKKALPIRYECYTCGDNKTEKQFPDYNPSAKCEHSIHTCKACPRKWVDIHIENNQTTLGGGNGKTLGIQCPECPSLMRAVNIQMVTIKKLYAQFEKLERTHIGDTTPSWRWCLSPHCSAGQVHETAGVENPKKMVITMEDKGSTYDTAIDLDTYEPVKDLIKFPGNPDICTCHECGFRACVPCDRPEHVGKTCRAYQLRIKDRVKEEDKAIQAIKRATKPCPHCGVRIQRKGGCPHMICDSCREHFIWTDV